MSHEQRKNPFGGILSRFVPLQEIVDSLRQFPAVAPTELSHIQSYSHLPIADVANRLSTQGFFIFVLYSRSLDAANEENVRLGWVSTSNWIAF